MTIKELLEDLLIEYDELGMQPTTIVPNPEDRAKEWKHELTYALKHLRSELAREIFGELYEDCFDQFGYIDYGKLAELKNKYTE